MRCVPSFTSRFCSLSTSTFIITTLVRRDNRIDQTEPHMNRSFIRFPCMHLQNYHLAATKRDDEARVIARFTRSTASRKSISLFEENKNFRETTCGHLAFSHTAIDKASTFSSRARKCVLPRLPLSA